jgi:intermediate cleaving peptidase 55
MRVARPGGLESDIAAQFDYTTTLLGASRPAYVPVVASGPSALTIHYTSNDLPVEPGSLVLFDAGCEYAGYASDITRTFPVDGTFTSPQRDLYEAVLSAERALITLCSARSGLTLNDLHRRSCELLRGELRQLGFDLRPGDLENRLYPHFVGHPLGIDLHDTPTLERSARLQSGMVITIEPGI